MNKKKLCPKCFWRENCSLPGRTQKDCQTFTTKEKLIKQGYLPSK